MRNKKFLFLFVLILFLTFFFITSKETTRSIGINYKVTEYQIPIYLKIFDFYNRHYNYKYLVKNINKNTNNEKEVILNTTKWIKNNIKKIPKGVDVVDNHALTIFERRLGTDDQFSDLLSVLLVYSNIDSFFIKKHNKIWNPLTFFKFNDYWSILDPYHGVLFVNDKFLFASIEDIKDGNWQILNLKFEKIDKLNLKDTFEKKFNGYDEIINYYDQIFHSLLSSKDIDNTHIFNRGGRSYTQDPLGRLRYKIYNFFESL
jgi:hypothetical protein